MENNRLKYRLKFQKMDRLRFIGHLDLLNLFHRALRRTGLPVAYSRGFNPHQETSFALPLSLGYYGLGECVDIIFTENIPGNIITEKLNRVMPPGISILSAKRLDEGEKATAAIVAAASYKVNIPVGTGLTSAEVDDFINQQEIVVVKTTKKSSSQTDIKPHILKLSSHYENGELSTMFLLLDAGPQKSVRADLVIEALFNFFGKKYNPYSITYTRECLYKLENSKLVEL